MAGPAIAVLASVALFLVGIGLCGIGMPRLQSSGGDLALAGLACFLLSALAFAVAVVWVIVAAIRTAARRGRGGQNT